MENFSAHVAAVKEVGGLSHTNITFLLLESTSIIRLLDQGIIKSFKGIYRKKRMDSMVHMLLFERKDPVKSMSILNAIWWLIDQWYERMPSSVANCWGHAELLLSRAPREQHPDNVAQAEQESTFRENIMRLCDIGYLRRDISLEGFDDPEDEAVDDGNGEELLGSHSRQFGENIQVQEQEQEQEQEETSDDEEIDLLDDLEIVAEQKVAPPSRQQGPKFLRCSNG